MRRVLYTRPRSAEATRGPALGSAPCRYVGVIRPMEMWWIFRTWCRDMNLQPASFKVFLGALRGAKGYLRFRKNSGQHPNCDICAWFKRKLKMHLSSRQRQEIIEDYCRHIADQLMDRHSDRNWMDMSLHTASLLRNGCLMVSLARALSVIAMRVDGMDQAKFRLPRAHVKTHQTDMLIRPALHVQGCWAHGFGFHFAVADADTKKDTTTNFEVVARMLESIYRHHRGLPYTLVLIQDNQCRECKNQKILKICAYLLVQMVFGHIWLVYPKKGHSHGPLDGVFGQAAVKLANSEFDDDAEVVQHLQDFLDDGYLEPGTCNNAEAYKLDEAAEWADWAAEAMDWEGSNLTGPEAPHSFHICARADLSPEEQEAPCTAWRGAPGPQQGDIVVAVRSSMSDRQAFQVALLVPHERVVWLQKHAAAQPSGIHERRPVHFPDREKLVKAAESCHRQGAISAKACGYLVDWARGTRRRHKRPAKYTFLHHHPMERAAAGTHLKGSKFSWERAPRLIVIKEAADGRPLPVEPEPEEDGGNEALQLIAADT